MCVCDEVYCKLRRSPVLTSLQCTETVLTVECCPECHAQKINTPRAAAARPQPAGPHRHLRSAAPDRRAASPRSPSPSPTAPSTHLAAAPGPPFPREQLTESQAENEKLKQDLIDAEAGCSSCCVLSSSGDTDSVVLLTLVTESLVYVVTCERRRAGEAVVMGAGRVMVLQVRHRGYTGQDARKRVQKMGLKRIKPYP